MHITGASGSGTTTLARALADTWAVPHADADDYFWLPTSPAFVDRRPVPERLALMESLFLPRDSWVLSGSVTGWGDSLIGRFDAVVFLALDPEVRLARLRSREALRLGATIAAGGARAVSHRAFMEWAAGYDDPNFDGRSRAGHERWLKDLPCPVLRLDADQALHELVRAVVSA